MTRVKLRNISKYHIHLKDNSRKEIEFTNFLHLRKFDMRLSNLMAVAKAKVISFLKEKKRYLVPEQAVDLLLLLFHPPGMREKSRDTCSD